jgi:hypothetical protein
MFMMMMTVLKRCDNDDTNVPSEASASFVQELESSHAVPYRRRTESSATPFNLPEGSRKLRFPDFMTTAQDGGKVVSLKHRPPLPPGNTPGTHFC